MLTTTTVSFIIAPISAAVAGFFWYRRLAPLSFVSLSSYYVPLTISLGCCSYSTWLHYSTSSLSSTNKLFISPSSSSTSSSSSSFLTTASNIGLCIFLYTLSSRFRCIGITGGIATGKSTVSKTIKKLAPSIRILDLDVIAREIVMPGEPAYHKIVQHFGSNVLLPLSSSSTSSSSTPASSTSQNNSELPGLNRTWLRNTIANSPEQRKILNNITHPAIFKRLFTQVAYYRWLKGEIVLIDAPLLFESGWILTFLCGPIIVTASPRDLQLQRLIERDNMDKQNAEKMIDTQMPLTKKIALADYVLYTIYSLEELEINVKKLLQTLHIL